MRSGWFLALALAVGALGVPATRAAANEADDAERKKWADLMGDLPFVIGYERGLKEVEFTGKPPMFFFCATWCAQSKLMAAGAFKNADVVKALAGVTPVIVDGDTDVVAKRRYTVGKKYPVTIFASATGEAVGPQIFDLTAPDKFLDLAQQRVKQAKAGKPTKECLAQTAAKSELDAALPKNQVAAALAAIAKIEKINHPGSALDAAAAAKKQLLEDGKKRLDAAKVAAKGDGKDAALKELKKIAAEYKDADVGTEAAKVVKEMEAAKDSPPK